MVADAPAPVPSRQAAPTSGSTAAVVTLPDGTQAEIADAYLCIRFRP